VSPPLIGITGRRVPAAQWSEVASFNRDTEVDLHFVEYVRGVARAGGLPVHVAREADPVALVDRLDGVLLSGGSDVDPGFYGAVPGPHQGPSDRDRDAFEIALARAAIDAGRPVLAICRGAQVLNVALGGTLVAHVDPAGAVPHSRHGRARHESVHDVVLDGGCRVAAIYGRTVVAANSFHHQAVDRPGDGVVVVGRTDDGVAEAIEVVGRDVLGVQWHPEMHGPDDPLFRWLVDAAARRSIAEGGAGRSPDRHQPPRVG
jgi:putative glutamine amidotransferase